MPSLPAVILMLAMFVGVLAFGPALAQGTPTAPTSDPQFMQNAIEALRQQRSNAEDQAASLAAQLASARTQLAKVQDELDELKKKEMLPDGPDKSH
jgi:septal ring factor EnvC (AmiA/AmiB activator)